jgi:hypothetical protein
MILPVADLAGNLWGDEAAKLHVKFIWNIRIWARKVLVYTGRGNIA